ncbi:ABC transporter ATP-binding protein [Roseibium denhamense]|uniref:Biotin transport system ATP-binding protein n=1 Tax=Roseibium denhamense TaxID=76305 RepID=A0ABY1PCA0_9HYPH|nr:ABC transporter ATP-binding protein [Roseibium denhamense]MTI04559.1 ABC transporter ATP-binding protein [Roseibium denhamense]SMP31283.1 biotin transport system ATP-binding protein [Roseibium denhamense]
MVFWRKGVADGANSSALLCDPGARPYATFEEVGMTIGGHQILDNISLSLEEHRIGVIGLNGSGKSSFVRLLNGLRSPSRGTLKLFGQIASDVLKELPRHVGFVFQNPDHQAIFPTVEEEIAFGLTQLGADKRESRDQARRFLDTHGCLHLAGKPIAELSEGQKQLVCILAVLVMKPSLLVLDEPLTSLDALASRRIRHMLLSLPQKIVMVSHHLDHLESFDRILWLEDGTLRMDGTPSQVLPAYQADIDRKFEAVQEAEAF